MEKIEPAQMYEALLSQMEKDLAEYGYKRSGKSALFYRYFADKKVVCGIEMQKSMFNTLDSYSFTMNLVCIAKYELHGYFQEKLTLSCLKTGLRSPAVLRMGHLCRGCDYWYELSEEILAEYGLQEYYTRFVRKDIQKSADYLNQLALKKESVFSGGMK